MAALFVMALCGCKDEKKNSDSEVEVSYSASIICDATLMNNQSSTITVDVSPSPAEGYISTVDLFLGQELLKTSFTSPYLFVVELKDLATGNHELNAVVKFSDGTIITAEKMFFFKVNLGDEYQGGVVIKLSDDFLHGTIASKTDLTGGFDGKYRYGAYNGNYQAYSMDDGLENTNKFSGKLDFGYAAIACLNLELNGYDDWYLPANNEVLLFNGFLEELNIPKYPSRIFWSSTGDSTNPQRAYAVPFNITFGTPCNVQGLYLVRPCRRF